MNRTFAAMLVGLLLSGAAPSLADDIRLEEDAVQSYGNIAGHQIEVKSCDGAENGLAVYGVDTAGEWVSYGFSLDASICFVDSLRSAGDDREYRELQIEYFLDPDFTNPVAVDGFASAEGRGMS